MKHSDSVCSSCVCVCVCVCTNKHEMVRCSSACLLSLRPWTDLRRRCVHVNMRSSSCIHFRQLHANTVSSAATVKTSNSFIRPTNREICEKRLFTSVQCFLDIPFTFQACLWPNLNPQVQLCQILEKVSLQIGTSGLQTARNMLLNTSRNNLVCVCMCVWKSPVKKVERTHLN